MIAAFAKAFVQMFTPGFIWVILRALVITIAVFAGLLWLCSQALGLIPEIDSKWFGWIDEAGQLAGFALIFVGMIVLLVPTAAVVLGIFLEEIADKVERRFYKDVSARDVPFLEGLGVGLRLLATMIVLNILFLPIYLLLAPFAPLIFLLLNGYLTGREFFEMVAMRHMSSQETKQLRRRNAISVLFAGIVITLLLMIPIANFVVPVFGAAFMTHVFHRIRRNAPQTIPA